MQAMTAIEPGNRRLVRWVDRDNSQGVMVVLVLTKFTGGPYDGRFIDVIDGATKWTIGRSRYPLFVRYVRAGDEMVFDSFLR